MAANNELLPDFDRGDRLTHQWVNAVSRQLNALSNTGSPVHQIATGAGTFFRTPKKLRIPKTTAADDGLPTGTGGCDCDQCSQGTNLGPSSGLSDPNTVCCYEHPVRSFIDPWTGDSRILKWLGGDRWGTDNFEKEFPEGCTNEFVWVMDQSAETLSLAVAVDNGCDPTACIVYRLVPGWECQCNLTFKRSEHNVPKNELTCYACVKPSRAEAEDDPFPEQDWGPVCFDLDSSSVPLAWVSNISGFEGVSCTATGGPPADSVQGIPWQYSGSVPCPSGGSPTTLVTDMNDASAVFKRSATAMRWEFDQYPITYDGTQITTADGLSRWTLRAACQGGVDPATGEESYGITLRLEPGSPPLMAWGSGFGPTGCSAGIHPASLNASVLTYGPFNSLEEAMCALNQAHTFDYDVTPADYGCDAGYFPGAAAPAVPATITLAPIGGGFGDCTNPPTTATEDPGPPDNDGKCSSCTADTAPVDDEGACCVDHACLDISEADCGVLGGDWYATDAECSAECGGVGTCCYCYSDAFTDPFITCLGGATKETCDALGGSWTDAYGDVCGAGGNDCGGTLGDPCTAGVTGACCDSEVCSITTEADCGGYWTEGASCEETDCDIAACCNCSSDACDDITQNECNARGAPWGWCGGNNACAGLPTCSFGCSGCL